jgi:hypothetical protein
LLPRQHPPNHRGREPGKGDGADLADSAARASNHRIAGDDGEREPCERKRVTHGMKLERSGAGKGDPGHL